MRKLAYEAALGFDVLFGHTFHNMLDPLQRVAAHSHESRYSFTGLIFPTGIQAIPKIIYSKVISMYFQAWRLRYEATSTSNDVAT